MFVSLTLARYLASCALEPRRRTELATNFFRGREVGLSAGKQQEPTLAVYAVPFVCLISLQIPTVLSNVS